MNKVNFIETLNKYLDLSGQTKFRLNEINGIKDYFNSEIRERKTMSKILSKYVDYILIILIRPSLFYWQQMEEYLLFLLQVLSEFL